MSRIRPALAISAAIILASGRGATAAAAPVTDAGAGAVADRAATT